MLKRIRTRRGQPPRPPDRWRIATTRASAAGADIAKTSLIALKESADGFPPLKGAAGAVLAVWNIAERVRTSKKEAKDIAVRCHETLEVLADAVVPEPFNICPRMQADIQKFTILLGDISQELEPLQRHTWMSSILRLNRNEAKLANVRQRLEEVHKIFMLSCALRTHRNLLEIRHDIATTSDKLQLLVCPS
ncbi:hypothetical protein FPV67DRAFT_1447530 [Lyophyllum atratum]|nr:hypothetical protein FPV67DRAFT_1447530 [Lyophyllum atratum]